MELSALSKLNITAPAQYKTTKPLINLNESHRVLLGCNVQRQSLNAYQSIFIMTGGTVTSNIIWVVILVCCSNKRINFAHNSDHGIRHVK